MRAVYIAYTRTAAHLIHKAFVFCFLFLFPSSKNIYIYIIVSSAYISISSDTAALHCINIQSIPVVCSTFIREELWSIRLLFDIGKKGWQQSRLCSQTLGYGACARAILHVKRNGGRIWQRCHVSTDFILFSQDTRFFPAFFFLLYFIFLLPFHRCCIVWFFYAFPTPP